VRLAERMPPPSAGRTARPGVITHDEFLEWRGRTTTLSTMVATIGDFQVMVTAPRGAARLSGGFVSPEWFELVGARPMLGRALQVSDVSEHRDVVVVSARVWRQLFGSDPEAIGRSITLRSRVHETMYGRPMEIVGVMPDGFVDPSGDAEFWAPMLVPAGASSPAVQVMGRLKPGVSIDVAEQEATAIGTARHREKAVRLAIGASRSRIIRQLLCESLVLSFLAASSVLQSWRRTSRRGGRCRSIRLWPCDAIERTLTGRVGGC
jgi:hypothetical protein